MTQVALVPLLWKGRITDGYLSPAPRSMLCWRSDVCQLRCFSLPYHLSKIVQEGQATSAEDSACCEEKPELWSPEALYGSALSKGNNRWAISAFIF